MSITNVFASVAVKDIAKSSAWYAALFNRAGKMTTIELAEWTFPQGGGLQVYLGPERAGNGSFTLSVSDIKAEIKKLLAIGIDAKLLPGTSEVKTVMIKDPDGNSIAFAEKVKPAAA